MIQYKSRIIGTYSKGLPGPTVCFIGGLHGNEPAGVHALEKVFAFLDHHPLPFCGKTIGLRGNLKALNKGKRFIDEDLNRLWSYERVERIRGKFDNRLNSEEKELRDIVSVLYSYMEEKENFYLIDLHTTSAPGGLFCIASEPESNIDLAKILYAPLVKGLANHLKNTTNAFITHTGIKGLAFESGQHLATSSVVLHEAAVWLILEKLGCIDRKMHPRILESVHQLQESTRHLPNVVQAIYRHAITPDDNFRLNPGYKNFDEVKKGELLGFDKSGAVYCPLDGLMLMPLYQSQGEEGFYLVKAVE